MPTLSRYMIKTALLYLAGAFALGAFMAFIPDWNGLRPVYLHFITLGWLTQLIMGVAYWMFPKFSRTLPRASEGMGWAVYLLLNLGLIFRSVGEGSMVLAPHLQTAWMLPLAALMLWLAGWCFIFNTWGRVKER